MNKKTWILKKKNIINVLMGRGSGGATRLTFEVWYKYVIGYKIYKL